MALLTLPEWLLVVIVLLQVLTLLGMGVVLRRRRQSGPVAPRTLPPELLRRVAAVRQTPTIECVIEGGSVFYVRRRLSGLPPTTVRHEGRFYQLTESPDSVGRPIYRPVNPQAP